MGSQTRFCVFYFLLTASMLLVMLMSCARVAQTQFFRSTEHSMETMMQYINSALKNQEPPQEIFDAMDRLRDMDITRLCLTDSHQAVTFDSHLQHPLPQIPSAFQLESDYRHGIIYGWCSFPRNDGQGWVYFSVENSVGGNVMQSLQHAFVLAAAVLLVVVTGVSILSASMFTNRLRTILQSIQVIRGGDYTHQISIGRHDELTLLANEFNLLTQRLREAELQQRRFVSDASHELKTPLASIKLLADSILQNDLDSETTREFVADISQEAERLTRLSSKLLSLQPIESTLDTRQVVSVAPAVYQVVRMLTPIAQQVGVTISQELEHPLYVWMLEDDLHQIVYNLLENAIKYNRSGGTIDIRLERQGTELCLSIHDTGVGIPEESLGLLFQRFYRVDKARSRQSGGSGLGLAIVREMVERSQGTIQVESVWNQGSTFTVVLPRFVSESS